MMRKILTLGAAAAAALAATTAHAAVLLIDDFNTPASAAVIVSDTATGGGITWQSAPASTTLSTPNIATTRRIGVEATNISASDSSGIESRVGGSAGRLTFRVDTGDNGDGYVEWTIPAFTVTTPAYYFFSVVASSLGTTANIATPTIVSFAFDGAGTNDFNSAAASVGAFSQNATGTPINFELSNTEALYLSGGGTLTMRVGGGEGWNLRLDQFSINMPEPTSLALVGLALVGAGIAARRRKA